MGRALPGRGSAGPAGGRQVGRHALPEQPRLPIFTGKHDATCREYVNAADIGKKGACHLFRHTMATLMLENGADIRFLQAMLGHVKLETTQIYTQVSIRKLKEIHTATHPARMNPAPLDGEKLL